MTIPKKICIALALLVCYIKTAGSDLDNIYRQQLQQLLEQRQQHFVAYTQSLDKNSGLFNNRTKRDITGTNNILKNLIKTDNEIIDVLNRIISANKFDKAGSGFAYIEKIQNTQSLLNIVDTLNKQLVLLSRQNNKLKLQNKRLTWGIYIISFVPLIIILFALRNKISKSNAST